ncbi:MAG: oxidoreductase [Kiritimatiellae bacterium]|nr:oxidoreductase [Kiritimatiellia bacterium]
MRLMLTAMAVLVAGGFGALLTSRRERLASAVGAGAAVAGCAIGLVPAWQVLSGAGARAWSCAWSVPFGTFSVEIDLVSALFLVPILALSGLAAVYGREYLAAWRGRKATGASWLFFNLLVASMVLVVIARNAVLFLVAWELMSLASFFLVTFDDEREDARRAGWIYLVATHIGTAFLLALFVLLGGAAGRLDFEAFRLAAPAGTSASVLFVLAVVGFGTKAGFMPLHVWLPEAHPAAPSHVSAVMSGVMIKTGIYGLVRVLAFLGPPPQWWGLALTGIGLTSGILGVLFALAQHDLKRLLAYHSVENIGIIALGLGLGLLGVSFNVPAVAIAGFAGALLHVINHAVFKGLLFLGAGAVAHSTGTRDIEHLGGLLKRMPWTGAAFLVGAAAISGLPPLNGFVSELLVYLGAFRGAVFGPAGMAIAALGVIVGLALVGGLAAACFAKAFGIVFLGEPRSNHAAHAHEVGPAMRIPMLILAAVCVLIGLAAPRVGMIAVRVAGDVVGVDPSAVAAAGSSLAPVLSLVVFASALLIALAAGLVLLRSRLLAGREVTETGTWDCGYLRPDARMQYTASSFADPLTRLFRGVLGTREQVVPPQGLFPRDAAYAGDTPDAFMERLFKPLFRAVASVVGRMRWLQHGRLQLYVLYIAVTLLVLLLWKL